MSNLTRRLLLTPSVISLLLWMIVPLGMTLYFSFMRYNLLYPERFGFTGLLNYEFFSTDPAIWPSVLNTLLLVGFVVIITCILGITFAVLLQSPLEEEV